MHSNPFTPTLVVPIIRIIRRDVPLMKLDLELGDYYEVEAVPSTRLYRIASSYDKIKGLSVTGYRLLMWIMYHIPDDALSIRLDEAKLSVLFECSCKTIQRARVELIKAAIIAKYEANRYWVNPQIFASNSRLKLYEGNTTIIKTVREKPLI